MKIKTKFELDDKVWIINDNKPIRLSVTNIKIMARLNGTDISYGIWSGVETIYRNEYECFSTKKELIDYFSGLVKDN